MAPLPKKKWSILEDVEQDLLSDFCAELNIPPSLAKILICRNITTKAEAKKYFMPELGQLHDPFLMKGMEKATERILEVIRNKENILIFGDYDVDGTSGVSMFHCFLRGFGVPNEVFIPDRFTDGYGLSNTGIDFAASKGIKLIVSIDCGITAYDKVEYAKSIGVDIIICDHHQPPANIPDAYAVLDALQSDCNYPFKSLCGTGVAFKLIQAVCIKLNSEIYLDLIDFAAIATAADMVPVVDENRILLYYGFKRVIEKPRPCYLTLIKKSGVKHENLTTSNVVFSLGPRINAVGRLGDAIRAVKFLTCETVEEAEELASVLESENTNRKKIDSEIYIQAQESYEGYIDGFAASETENDDVAIILHNPEWHPGVLGIIASRMVEKYYRPSIILTTFNGYAKGSARSVSNFNIYEALKKTSEECTGVVQFGGHYHAAGIEIEIDSVDEFRSTFNRIARNIINDSHNGKDILIPEIKIDSEIDIAEIDQRFVKILRHFGPFGPGNMMPVFTTKNVQVVGEPKVYNSSTYVFKVRKCNENEPVNGNGKPNGTRSSTYYNNVFDCVFYQSPALNDSEKIPIRTGSKFDLVYSIEENHWNGNTKTQLRIRDIK